MKLLWAPWLPVWTFLALVSVTLQASAQVPMPGMPQGPYPEAAGGPVPYPASPESYQGAAPASYAMPSGPMMDPSFGYGGYGEDCAAGGGEVETSLFGKALGFIGPYGDGGNCAPRWFDISVDAMWLHRDEAGRNILFSSNGIGGNAALQTNDLAFEDRPSFKLTAAYQFRSAGALEFTYYGLFHWNDTAQATDPTNNLYSAISNFGTLPFNGFLEDGQAAYQRIEYASTFDNFELNYRRRWQGPGCRYQGSFLWGLRHFSLNEDFNFISVSTVNSSQLKYAINVNNAVTGAQIGSDLWVSLIPGLRIGTEGKVGVYGNHAQQDTVITATSLPFYTEGNKENDVAFVGDAAFMLTYRLNYQFTLKAAYNFLVVNGVSLASENFNATPPEVFINGSGRTAQLNDNGNVFYHGWSGGIEYNW